MNTKMILLAVSVIVSVSANAQMQTRIIGGTTVSSSTAIGQRTVGLFFQGKPDAKGQASAAVCTGSIVDESHVITAAHCVQDFYEGAVIFTAGNMFAILDQASKGGIASVNGQLAMMESAVALPGFPGMDNSNNANEFVDLAVITFKGGLPTGYEAAKFLAHKDVLAALKTSKTATLAGYGMTSAPQELSQKQTQSFDFQTGKKPKAPTTPSDDGSANDGFPAGVGTLRKVSVSYQGLSNKEIDIYFVGKANHIACEGDSGGPASVTYQGETYVVGVDSRGDCASNAIYGLIDQETLNSAI